MLYGMQKLLKLYMKKLVKENDIVDNSLLDKIPESSLIQKTDNYYKEIEKYINYVLEDIEKANSRGFNYTTFNVDYRYEEEVKRLFMEKGYRFKPTGYIGGVWQRSTDICW